MKEGDSAKATKFVIMELPRYTKIFPREEPPWDDSDFGDVAETIEEAD